MRVYIISFVAGFIGLFTLASCNMTEPISVFEKHNIPQQIEDDFFARFGDVEVTDAAQWSFDGHIAIDFNDRKGLPCEAIYQDGEWLLTTKDLGEDNFLSNLPFQVRKSFNNLGYAHPRFDILDNTNRVYEITRKGIDHTVYDFRFHIELEDGSFTSIQILINEDGLVLLNSREGYNRQELWYWTDTTPLNIINEKYPEADVRSYANYGGLHQYFIIHDGKIKIVTFNFYSPDFVWKETVFLK